MRRFTIPVITDGSGNATVLSPRVAGKIHSIQYVKDVTTPFADGVDFAVSAQATGENIWTESNVNASAVRYPRAPVHSQAGAAALYATGGTAVQDRIGVVDRVKIVIAQGGAAKNGEFHLLVD